MIDKLKKIDQLKDILSQEYKNIHLMEKIHEQMVLDWTYNTNAIEGNRLTLRETQLILEGITVGGKPLREHLEVINHKYAIDELERIVTSGEPISEEQIKKLHNLVLRTIDDANAGNYRNVDVRITGAAFRPPQFYKIKDQMFEMIQWYEKNRTSIHPIFLAAELHTRFVKIHPFIDGNGRTARLLLNFELLKNGYPPAIVKYENKERYYKALEIADEAGDHSPLADIICDALLETLQERLQHLQPEDTTQIELKNSSIPKKLRMR